MVESLTPNRKVVRLSLGPSEIVVGGVNTVLSSPSIPRRSALEQGTELPTAPGRRSINGCPLLWVCVHGVCVHCCVCALGWVNAENEFRAWVAILGCMSRHLVGWFCSIIHTVSWCSCFSPCTAHVCFWLTVLSSESTAMFLSQQINMYN